MKEELKELYQKDWVAVEMARRRKAFHKNEKWDKITLWGLFYKTDVLRHLKKGWLKPHGEYGFRCLGWYQPNKEYWEQHIKPIVLKFTLEELQETF